MDKLFVVVRSDLPAGLQIPQAGHAMRLFAAEHPVEEARWYRESNNLVVLSVPSKEELVRLAYELTTRGISVSLFREPDCGDEPTALAAAPGARRWLSTLPLALRERRDEVALPFSEVAA